MNCNTSPNQYDWHLSTDHLCGYVFIEPEIDDRYWRRKLKGDEDIQGVDWKKEGF